MCESGIKPILKLGMREKGLNWLICTKIFRYLSIFGIVI